MSRTRAAFTLIELMLAIAMAVIVMAMAIPSVRGMSAEQRLHATFDKLDDLAHKAQLNAVSQQRSWVLVWQEGKILLQPDDPSAAEKEAGGEGASENMEFGKEESYTLERPFSLLPPKDTPGEWTFWRSGVCEPVRVLYAGPDGSWTAVYNPLTGHGEITDQQMPK